MTNDTPSLVIDRLYLGNMNSANNHALLRRLRVTHVLSVCPRKPTPMARVTYLQVSVDDVPEERISKHFNRCTRFINHALAAGGVLLVHCYAGVSRSATVLIAYLMKMKQMTYPEALGCVYRSRPIVNPNIGFVLQLQDYSASLQRSLAN